MPSRAQSVTISYVAWDTVNNVGKTGDVANHTLRWVKDGTSSAPTNSPSEVDSTNAKGVYKITLTSAEATCNVGTLAGVSSTSGVSIIPITVSFEQLPTAAPGAASGLLQMSSGSSGTVSVLGGLISVGVAADGIGSASIASAAYDAIADRVLDYALTNGAAGGMGEALTLLLARLTSTRAGYLDNLTNLDAAVSTRSTYAGADTAGTTTLLSRLTGTRAGLLDNLANLDATITSTASASALSTVSTNVSAIGVIVSSTGAVLTQAERNSIANTVLGFNLASVTGAASRSLLNAVRFLRNKWSISGSTLTVTAEDDATTAWTATIARETDAVNSVKTVDPA